MADATIIKAAIKSSVISSKLMYADWTIGITSNIAARKTQKETPLWFRFWEADSLAVAQEVKQFFIEEFPANIPEKMGSDEGWELDDSRTIYVYIF